MIDLHSHIAWNIDDGMPNKTDALEALQMAQNDGITAICSTPHFVPGQMDAKMVQRIHARQEELRDISPIHIYFGAEVMMNSSFIEELDEKWYQPINGTKYMLVEYDVRKGIHRISNFMDPLYELRVRGYIPVLAHIERYFHHGLDWDIIHAWQEEGYVLQINRPSIMGMHGKQMEKNAKELLVHGVGHVVATDTHRARGYRVECLSDAYGIVSKWIGTENAELLFNQNPMSILQGKDVCDVTIKKKRRFHFFGR
jgi:protein-tyrosine phosphatase